MRPPSSGCLVAINFKSVLSLCARPLMGVATNAGAQLFVTVNYGSGSPEEAAAWVAYANGNAALYGTTNDLTLGVDASGPSRQG